MPFGCCAGVSQWNSQRQKGCVQPSKSDVMHQVPAFSASSLSLPGWVQFREMLSATGFTSQMCDRLMKITSVCAPPVDVAHILYLSHPPFYLNKWEKLLLLSLLEAEPRLGRSSRKDSWQVNRGCRQRSSSWSSVQVEDWIRGYKEHHAIT